MCLKKSKNEQLFKRSNLHCEHLRRTARPGLTAAGPNLEQSPKVPKLRSGRSSKLSPRQKHIFPRTPLTREGRFAVIEAWGTKRMGAPATRLGPAETRARLPKLMGLRYNAKATHSPAGGRFDFHLRHLRDSEVLERLARADRFVKDTKVARVDDPAQRQATHQSPAEPASAPRPPSAQG